MSRYYICKERADDDVDVDDDGGVDDADEDGGADLVFMAVCRPTHGSTILFHSLQSHREGVLGGWGEGAGGTRTVLQQSDAYQDSLAHLSQVANSAWWFDPQSHGVFIIWRRRYISVLILLAAKFILLRASATLARAPAVPFSQQADLSGLCCL